MYYYLALVLMVGCALVGLRNWRLGLVSIILLAALQDPLRKMVPGTPGLLALLTAPVFLASLTNCWLTTRGWWPEFSKNCPRIAKPMMLLIVLCLPSAAISATYGEGSWMLTILGAFSYSIIFLAIIAGFHFARRGIDLRLLLIIYCTVHGVVLVGGYLEYFGFFSDWLILSDKAMGFKWQRSVTGYVVNFIAGFYRSGDVMGWHAAAVACLSITLALGARGERRWVWIALSVFAIGALLFCGRRKMVYMLPVFLTALLFLFWQARRARALATALLFAAIPIVGLVGLSDYIKGESTSIRYYTSTSDETVDSLERHGLESVVESFNQAGFFGSGLGVATPGSHHLNVERPRVWQESAPSRIAVELGALGMLGLALTMFGIVLSCWRTTKRAMQQRHPLGPYAAGLLAFFVANVGSLTVSGQILADPFIASFLGLMVGLVLSVRALPFDLYESRYVKNPQSSVADYQQAHV